VNEHGFIKSVHSHLPSSVYKWKIRDTYTGGIPDVFYAGPQCMMFIEYKYVKNFPVRSKTNIKCNISALQQHWLQRMHSQGHKVAVVLGVGREAVIMLDKRWCKPIAKEDFLKNSLSIKQIAKWIENTCI